MSLSSSNIDSLRNVFSDNTPTTDSILNDAGSAITNPIGGKLNKILFKINGLTTSIEGKIDKLVADTAKQGDNKATVQLINNTLVVSAKPEDSQVAQLTANKIQSHISSINGSLGQLTTLVDSLNVISKVAQTLQKALEIQEMLLNLNPVTKATFSVFKKAIKIVFLKDMLKQYTSIISAQLSDNKNVLNNLTAKFHQLHVQTKISDSGDTISTEQAEQQIATDNASAGNTRETYTAQNGNNYLLKVEPYDTRKLIGRAYDSFSGQIVTQTAPSLIATSSSLMDELKRILDTQ